jgi:SnoaL-like domain
VLRWKPFGTGLAMMPVVIEGESMETSLAARVDWLIDRALIGELLFSFARALDTKDWQAYHDNYTDDGYIELPDPQGAPGATFILRKAEMLEKVPKSLGRYRATHHMSCNHQIAIHGDGASSRSYLQAVHVTGAPTDHWTAGGWYDCEYRRTPRGWKFTRVLLTAVWLAGAPGAIKPEA